MWRMVATLLLLIGCAPLQAPAGPEVVEPVLHEAHVVAADGALLPLRSWLPQVGPLARLW